MRPAHLLSSVESYRRGTLTEWRYDLADPLDLAIWTALQAYVDYLETIDLETNAPGPGVLPAQKGTIYGSYGTGRLSARAPRDLEDDMLELRDAERGKGGGMTDGERFGTALRILEGLSLPAQHPSGRTLDYGDEEYRVRRNFWEDGARVLEELDEETATRDEQFEPSEGGPWPRRLAPVASDPPLFFPERVAPLYGLLERSLGRLVSQSDAARRLGLTPRGMALRIEREGIQRVRVGQYVFIPEEAVEAAEGRRERDRSGSARG
jgi:hypothetical protein